MTFKLMLAAAILMVLLLFCLCLFASSGKNVVCCKCQKELPDNGFVFVDDEGCFCRECAFWYLGFTPPNRTDELDF